MDSRDPDAPLIVLFHGLGGSGSSHYARSLAWTCQRQRWNLAIPEFGNDHLHLSEEESSLAGATPRLLEHLCEQNSGRPLYVLGISFGALPLLHWLARDPQRARHLVTAAAAVSAPIDFEGSARRIMAEGLPLYRWNFIRSLTSVPPSKTRQGLRAVAASCMEGVRGRADFLPRSLSDYINVFSSWSAWQPAMLMRIVTPTLLLNARNDPCLSNACYPSRREVAATVRVEYPEQGGHVGFVTGAFPGRLDWLPRRVMAFFASCLRGDEVPAAVGLGTALAQASENT